MKNYILFEIDKGLSLPTEYSEWIKHSPELWKITYSWIDGQPFNFSYGLGAWGYGAYGSSGSSTLPAPSRSPVIKVGSLLVDVEDYVKVDSIAECEAQDKSFYFNIETQILYVNFEDDTMPYDFDDISLGVTKGYSNFPIVFEGVQYGSRVKAIPKITQKRDALFFGKVVFEGGAVTLVNMDHHFDTLDQEDVFGKVCRLRYSIDDGATFTTVYTGKLQDYKLNGDDITINLKDVRKSLLSKVSPRTFNKTTYPGISDDTDGSPIPFGYGVVRNSLAFCINEETGTTSFDFKFCDPYYGAPKSIQKVYVEGKQRTTASQDVANGEFTLSSSDYEPGDEVTIDYTGYNITNGLEIIENLLLNFAGIEYNSNFYNTTDWEAVKAEATEVIGFGIVEDEPLIDIIGNIATSIFGIFNIDGDGRFNFKLVDNTKTPVTNLKKLDYMSAPPPTYNSKEYISTAKIEYKKGIVSEKGPIWINDSQEQSLFIKYDVSQPTTFTTYLVDELQVSRYSDTIMDTYGGIFPTWTITTKMQTLDIELEDVVDAELYEDNGNTYDVRLEVIGKSVDYIKNIIVLTLRFIDYPEDIPITAKIIRR